MTIYIYGCTTCGVTAHYIRRVLKDNPRAIVRNSKYDDHARELHAAYLQEFGMVSEYTPIVVEGGDVTRLDEWNTSS